MSLNDSILEGDRDFFNTIKRKKTMKTINKETFSEITSGSAIVQFSATWCGPCKTLSKTIEANTDKLATPIYKLDIDAEPALASEYGVRSVPTMIRFFEGKEIDRMIGVKPPSQLIEFAALDI